MKRISQLITQSETSSSSKVARCISVSTLKLVDLGDSWNHGPYLQRFGAEEYTPTKLRLAIPVYHRFAPTIGEQGNCIILHGTEKIPLNLFAHNYDEYEPKLSYKCISYSEQVEANIYLNRDTKQYILYLKPIGCEVTLVRTDSIIFNFDLITIVPYDRYFSSFRLISFTFTNFKNMTYSPRQEALSFWFNLISCFGGASLERGSATKYLAPPFNVVSPTSCDHPKDDSGDKTFFAVIHREHVSLLFDIFASFVQVAGNTLANFKFPTINSMFTYFDVSKHLDSWDVWNSFPIHIIPTDLIAKSQEPKNVCIMWKPSALTFATFSKILGTLHTNNFFSYVTNLNAYGIAELQTEDFSLLYPNAANRPFGDCWFEYLKSNDVWVWNFDWHTNMPMLDFIKWSCRKAGGHIWTRNEVHMPENTTETFEMQRFVELATRRGKVIRSAGIKKTLNIELVHRKDPNLQLGRILLPQIPQPDGCLEIENEEIDYYNHNIFPVLKFSITTIEGYANFHAYTILDFVSYFKHYHDLDISYELVDNNYSIKIDKNLSGMQFYKLLTLE